jgi:signal transduction histidine kinase
MTGLESLLRTLITRRSITSIILLMALAGPAYASKAATAYDYSDTREVVDLVQVAAKMLATQGMAAFNEFDKPGSRWRHDTTYVYVFTADGDCLFNSGQPGLVGKNLATYRDVGGRPVVQDLMNIAASPDPHADGWIFFLFQEGNVLTPVWKIAYNAKTILPDGRIVVVGSGRSSLKMERSFVINRVEEAAKLLEVTDRDAAFKVIADPASHFNFLGSYVFVLDLQGHTLVDPSFPTMPGRDLSGMTDAIGRPYVQELLSKLAVGDTASTMFFWRANPNDVPQRKAIYARKVSAGGTEYIVGTEYLLPTPLWMK